MEYTGPSVQELEQRIDALQNDLNHASFHAGEIVGHVHKLLGSKILELEGQLLEHQRILASLREAITALCPDGPPTLAKPSGVRQLAALEVLYYTFHPEEGDNVRVSTELKKIQSWRPPIDTPDQDG